MGGRGSKSARTGGTRAEAQENAAADNVPTREAGERRPPGTGTEERASTPQARATAAAEAQNQANKAERYATGNQESADFYTNNPQFRPPALSVAGARLDASKAFTHAKNARTQANKAGTAEARAAATRAEAAAKRADANADVVSNAFRTRQGDM